MQRALETKPDICLRDLGMPGSGVAAAWRLTSREWDVLAALADRLSTREIGRRLQLKQSGVRAHISAVVRKLGVKDREEAIAFFRDTTGG